MRRLALALSLIVVTCFALPPAAAAAQDPRLVVFEAFLTPACSLCTTAGPIVDGLATEYAGRPVLFLEQDDDSPVGNRFSRFQAADPSSTAAGHPYAMVSSGHAWSGGPIGTGGTDFAPAFRAMVDAELARPARAEVEAYSVRVGNAMRVYITATNLGPAISAANGATVNALVYENVAPVVGANMTGRYVRGVQSLALTAPLATGETASWVLNVTPGLTRTSTDPAWVDSLSWANLRTIAFLEYRPGGATGPYDMLQAARAPLDGIVSLPDNLHFAIDSRSGSSWVTDLPLSGPSTLTWTVSSDRPWLRATPATLQLPQAIRIEVDLTGMAEGEYQGQLTLQATAADGTPLLQTMAVAGSYAVTYSIYVPAVLH